MNGKEVTNELAILTLKKAITSQPKLTGQLILHSDQGSQYTSKSFTDFCHPVKLIQSMSKAGCSFDNAPMANYYNTGRSTLFWTKE